MFQKASFNNNMKNDGHDRCFFRYNYKLTIIGWVWWVGAGAGLERLMSIMDSLL